MAKHVEPQVPNFVGVSHSKSRTASQCLLRDAQAANATFPKLSGSSYAEQMPVLMRAFERNHGTQSHEPHGSGKRLDKLATACDVAG
jgi:hypothetical protein